jgi:peptidoglycan/xylan/chitin deacetylase (PgdA/CDA1 family)
MTVHTAASILFGTVLLFPSAAVAQQPGPPSIEWTPQQIADAVAPVRACRKLTPPSWPNGARVAVCLSFDVDNETLGLNRGNTAPVSLSAGEFGAVSGLPRVLELLDRHEVPASFFLPAVSAMLHPGMIHEILRRDRHEIGVHGWIHENLSGIDDPVEEKRLMNQAIDYLTRMTGKRPLGDRAPSWVFSKYTIDLIQEAGFLYDSSMMAMDEPYELVSMGQPTGMVELPVEWILDDAPYFGRSGSLPSPNLIFEAYRDEFDVAYGEGTMLMLTMHPQVIGPRSRMVYLDKLVTYMRSKPGVWFATAEQIANYIKQSNEAMK